MRIICHGHRFQYEMTCLCMLFFPGQPIVEDAPETGEGDFLRTERIPTPGVPGDSAVGETVLRVECVVQGRALCDEARLMEDTPEYERTCERKLAVMAYHLLSEATGKRPKWGILTGVRPVKLLQRSLDEGMSPAQVREMFLKEYLVSPQKLELAMRAQRMEHEILSRNTPESYSLYISIPFCPSRCLYCSFVSHSIEKTYRLIDPYVDRLCEEIALSAQVAKDCGLILRTVYFGGGTPTAISAQQLQRLIEAVEKNFDLSQIWEYTIEAGRPDTITREKLEVIRDAGVTRISINPQTLVDEVLRFVGRGHTAADLERAYQLAREMGFSNINMDLIAGLPTDTLDGFRASVDGIIALGPENVTVHTLSVKRAADLSGAGNLDLTSQAEDVAAMVDYSQQALMEAGYGPYYLYRQKNTLDNLENTGYCRPGAQGLYNVYIMDETHTILACGAGAVTKLRQPGGAEIERVFNFKFPYEYLDRFDQIVKRKEQVKRFYERYPISPK